VDLHLRCIDNDTVNQEFDQRTLLGEVRLIQTTSHGRSELFQLRGHDPQLIFPNALGCQPLFLPSQLDQPVLQLRSPLLQLFQTEHFSLVGIDQPLDASLHLQLSTLQVSATSHPLAVIQPSFLRPAKGFF
jgi:hypothetical protein